MCTCVPIHILQLHNQKITKKFTKLNDYKKPVPFSHALMRTLVFFSNNVNDENNIVKQIINLVEFMQSTPEDDYVSFMVYLRTNSVWKTVSDVFRMLNETRPKDPIE